MHKMLYSKLIKKCKSGGQLESVKLRDRIMGKRCLKSSFEKTSSIIRPAQHFLSWFVPPSHPPEGTEWGEGHSQPPHGALPWEKQGWYSALGTPAQGDGLWLCWKHKTSLQTVVVRALKVFKSAPEAAGDSYPSRLPPGSAPGPPSLGGIAKVAKARFACLICKALKESSRDQSHYETITK